MSFLDLNDFETKGNQHIHESSGKKNSFSNETSANSLGLNDFDKMIIKKRIRAKNRKWISKNIYTGILVFIVLFLFFASRMGQI